MSKRKGKPLTTPKSTRGVGRTRTFATLVYPTKDEYEAYYTATGGDIPDQNGEIHHADHYDGADGWGSHPDDWQEIIVQSHVSALISPMHIGDHNPDGSVKKPHWHVEVTFESVKDYDTQIKPFFDSFGGVGREAVGTARGYARYLCHIDNPEKFQYNPAEVICYGGANWEAITHLPTDDDNAKRLIEKFARANDIHSYAELCDVLADSNPEWYHTVERHTYHFVNYLQSLTWEASSGYVRTGERQKHIHNFTGHIAATDGEEADSDESED